MMKNKRLLRLFNDIDEKHIEEAVPTAKKARRRWVKWAALAACLCLILVGVFAIEKAKTPVLTPESSSASGVAILYRDKTYIALISPEERKAVGLPETVTEDVIGEHLAFMKLDGGVADYVEASGETDIELYACTVNTTREVLILRDGEAFWPIVRIEK